MKLMVWSTSYICEAARYVNAFVQSHNKGVY